MTTLQQYLRRCDLNIGNLLIQETLRIVFSIRLGGDSSQQPTTIRIWNLATATASTITEKDTPVMLQAGYADTPLGLLYEGQVRRGDTERHRLDRITTVAMGNADEQKSILFNRSYMQIALPTLIRDIVGTMGLTAHPSISIVPNETLAEWSYVGRCRDALNALLMPRGIRWYNQGGMILFGNDKGTPAAGAFTLSQASGLIGSPARTEDGMKAKMVLNADIELGQTITLQSIQLTGGYKVKTILHYGDTWDGEWATGVEAVGAPHSGTGLAAIRLWLAVHWASWCGRNYS